nr:carbamoyltransferase C-terminal domain-containing protein [Xanthomonas albilineans]
MKQHWNPRYHALIKEFYSLTSIPLVLNTSFNVMGKPIAHSVEDALSIFFTSGLDAMFIDDVLIEK